MVTSSLRVTSLLRQNDDGNDDDDEDHPTQDPDRNLLLHRGKTSTWKIYRRDAVVGGGGIFI